MAIRTSTRRWGLNANPGAEVLSISLTGATGPSHGSISVVDGKIVYTPAANYNGPDSFEYFVTDGEAQDKGLVTVTVAQINDNPVAVADTATTNEDTAITIDVLSNDTDVDTNSTLNKGTLHSRSDLSISLESITTQPAHGGISVVSGKVVYTPNANWYGTDTFTYFVLDGHGGQKEGTVTVTVNSVNDLPVFVTNPANMELTEDGANGSSSFSVSDVETAAASLSVTVISSSNTTLVRTTDVTITAGTDGARTVTVNPRDNQNGTANIKLARDGRQQRLQGIHLHGECGGGERQPGGQRRHENHQRRYQLHGGVDGSHERRGHRDERGCHRRGDYDAGCARNSHREREQHHLYACG